MQVLKWSSWHFLSQLVLQKINEDNFNELDDYGALFSEQYTHWFSYISLFKIKSFDQLIPRIVSNFRPSLNCGTIVWSISAVQDDQD